MLRMADLVAAIKEKQLFQPQRSSCHSLHVFRSRFGGNHRVGALHQTIVYVLPEVTVTVTPEAIVIGPALMAFLPEVTE